MAKKKTCCPGGVHLIGVILLAAAILWLLEDLAVIALGLPYLPIIVLLVILKGMILHKKMK